jgi:secreted trypsin-like serine protease
MEAEMGVFPRQACNDGIRGYVRDGIEMILRAQAPSMHIDETAIRYGMEVIEAGLGDPLSERMICAGTQTGEISSCNGDSGGPLFVNGDKGPIQIGVVSWGAGPLDSTSFCGHENAYAVYARISQFRQWIKDKSGV